MRQILGLTNDPKQQFEIALDGYDTVQIALEFKPNQLGWFMNVIWGDFSTYNLRVTAGPNILRAFRNIIPFGIAIDSTDGIDPVTVDDWTGHNDFYVLEQADLAYIEGLING